MTDNRYGDKPLGKSVEEVESETGNRVNSPLPGEARRDLEVDAAIVPAIVGGGGESTGAVPAIINSDALVEGGSGPDDRQAPDRGTSES
ncbi:hypothetical protein ACFP9V_11360 [Deinococcus radiopugnans]|uniref:Uncharacterized protein n=1 Tax=Deinococcus radiopugnans ATCC 19172 TaxID=585398 RepID=A0A5C4Y9S7_9DEIO|nr:hypothetical protein [Deinococcus radiopugnans]MBB6015997.1 hypothetical protein [Deinococcus radiopugnans ATCC 19172]TNM72319.1 hypothetical protein FHR04_03180 [Deinococcus radiopugnans ATCC 19172]